MRFRAEKLARSRAGALITVLLPHVLAASAGCTSSPPFQAGSSLRGAENCSNGRDDDSDQHIDCADEDCATTCLALPQRPEPAFETCGESGGDREEFPVDMIFMLDSSPSMKGEIERVVANLESMGNLLRALSINVHFVLLGGPEVCVPPPLGGPSCGNSDMYFHLPQPLGNQETLRSPVDLFPRYHSFLRREADRVLIAVSDDNPAATPAPDWPSGVTPDTFETRLRTLGDQTFADYVFHSIVAFPEDGGRHPRGCRTAQQPGEAYLALTERTGGLRFSVCNSRESDWRAFFADLADATAKNVHVPCDYPRVALTDAGESTDPHRIDVHVQKDGRWHRAEQLETFESCGEAGGFALEGNDVKLCPADCMPSGVTRVLVYRGCFDDPIPDPN